LAVKDDQIVSTLSSVDLFAGLSPRVLARIAGAGHVEEFKAGADVVHAGEPVSGFRAFSPKGVEMHVILAGQAVVVVNGRTVGTLNAGEYFGELSLIDGQPRSADVIAADGGLSTFALPRWSFDELLAEHAEIAVPILRVLAARLRRAEATMR
jgi:CRP-like cAMP-binding protein